VEDEVVVATHLELQLEQAGFRVCGRAASGREALRLVQGSRPDLILMDIVLEGVPDGIATAEEIRRRWSTPVVFLTAHNDRETLLRAKAAEPYGYLLKPFNGPGLKSTIEMALHKAAGERSHREREDLLRVFADFTSNWETLTDREGNLVYVSPSCEQITGHPREEFLSRPDLMESLVHPGDLVAWIGHLRWAHSHQEAGRLDFRIITPQGQERWIEHFCRPVKDESGALTGRRASNLDITRRMKAELALKESERRFRELVEGTDDLITRVDSRVRFTYLNHTARRIFGLEPEQCLGRSALEFVHPGDREASRQAFRSWLGNRVSSVTWENRQVSLEGRVHHLLWTINLHYGPGGRLSGANAIGRDITFLKEAERELSRAKEDLESRVRERTAELIKANDRLIELIAEREKAQEEVLRSRLEFQALAENAPDIIARYDRELRYVYVNRAIEEVTGWPGQEFLGKTNLEAKMPRRLSADWDRELERVFESGRESSLEFRFRSPAGPRHYQTRLVPERAGDGSVTSVLAVSRDITALKAVERALVRSERRYRSLVENLPDVIYEVDREGRLTFVNSSIKEVLGFGPEEAAGRLWREFVLPEDRAGFDRLTGGAGPGAEAASSRIRHLTKDGQIRWLSVHSRPLPAPRDSAGFRLGVVRDVTHQTLAEARVRQLSRELIQAQEEERQRLALDLHDETGQLLSALKIGLQAVGRSKAGDWAHRAADLERLTEIAQQVMDRVRTLAYTLRPAILDKFGLALAIEDLCEGVAETSGLKVEARLGRLEESLLSAEIKTTLFRFVQEGLTNAVRHSGSRRVEVKLGQEEGMIRAQVRDWGSGFEVERVLDRALGERRLGLMGMMDRLSLSGGRLTIDSGEKGTVLRAEGPLAEAG